MRKTYNNPDTVATPPGPFSHVARVELGEGTLLFVSGQAPIDRDLTLVGTGDIDAQAEQVFRNIRAVLEANGATMSDVVTTTTYLTDISHGGRVNEARARHFADTAPASSMVEVSALGLAGMLVEIEVVAAT